LSRDLRIARGFSLPSDYITKTAAILAKKRIGKTYNASVIAEEFVRAGLPFVVLDPTSAWWGLRSSADGEKDGLPVIVIGGEHGDVPLDVGDGRALADLVIEEPSFYVLDLGHWESDSEHRRFAAPFLDRIYRAKSKKRDPLHMFIDEADVFAPQKPQKGDEQMLHNMQAIVRRGGIRGLGTTLITQRAAVLNKDVLTQLDLLIILRTISPQDQDAVDDYIKRGAAGQRAEIMASLASLNPGEAWLYGPGEEPPIVKRVQFRHRRTFNSSATPDGQQAPEPRKLAAVDLVKVRDRLAATIERARADDPATLHKRIRELEKELRDRVAAAPERVEVEVPVPYVPDEIRKTLAKLRDAVVDVKGYVDELEVDINEVTPVDQLPGADRVTPVPARTEYVPTPAAKDRPPAPSRPSPMRSESRPARAEINGNVSGSQQRILDALASLEAIGQGMPVKTQVALFAKASPKSSGYTNNLGALRSAGAIDYPQPGRVALTDHGRELAVAQPGLATDGELHAFVRHLVGEAKWRILDALIGEYPHALSKQDLAAAAAASPTSSGYTNNLGSLRSLGLIDYPEPGMVAALPVLFPGGHA
jgi:hypothetical protein